MRLITKTSETSTTSKKNRKIDYIVIHYTAGVTSAGKSDENVAAWFARLATKASSDFIVDDDSVTQFNGDIRNRYTWHCGGSKYKTKGGNLYGVCKNANSIGVEICSSNKTGSVTAANDGNWYFTDATLRNAAELVCKLMDEYGIDADHVIRHYDVTGKLCPGVIGWNADSGDESEWMKFKTSLIQQEPDYKSMYAMSLERISQLEHVLTSIRDSSQRVLEQ